MAQSDYLGIFEDSDINQPHAGYVPPRDEFVVEPSGNSVRQAGTTDTAGSSIQGEFIGTMKLLAERKLFVFAKTILGMDRLTDHLHKEVCNNVQKCPPYRKLFLLPRDCFKTTIISKALPLHMFIQQPDTNPYMPGFLGRNVKILLACETVDRGKKHITWIEAHLEKNELLRAFWPDVMWDAPRRDARAWNATEFFLPRDLSKEQSDPTMHTVGVGGAITGGHFDVIIDDDLVTFEAMNSQTVMQEAIQWHTLSRALLEDLDTSLEFIVGTHWAVHDLYTHIRKNDPTVEIYKRSLVEDGKIIFPEEFSEAAVAGLRASFGPMFPLLYQNDPRDSELCDFSEGQLRYYELIDGCFVFSEEPVDRQVEERLLLPRPDNDDAPPTIPTAPFAEPWDVITSGRHQYLDQPRE